MNKKYFTLLIAIVLIIPIVVNLLMMITTPITQGKIGDWIGFFGSFSGAVVGGVVAYTVAKIQIDSVKRNENNARIIMQLPTFVELKLDLEKLISYLKTIHRVSNAENTPIPHEVLALSTFENAYEIDKYKWSSLDRIIEVNLLDKIIRFREFYINFYDVISFNLNELGSKLNNIDIKIKRLEQIKKRNEKQEQELKDLITEKMPLHNLYEVYKSEKQSLWNKIKRDDFLDKALELDNILNDKIEQIEKQV